MSVRVRPGQMAYLLLLKKAVKGKFEGKNQNFLTQIHEEVDMTATINRGLHAKMLEARLERQNRLIDVLETEIDRAKTEAETEVILEVLGRARERLEALEYEACCERAGIPTGAEVPFPRVRQPELHGWFIRELNA